MKRVEQNAPDHKNSEQQNTEQQEPEQKESEQKNTEPKAQKPKGRKPKAQKQQNTEQPQEPEQQEPEQKEPEQQESEQKNTEPKSQKPKARKPKAQPPKNLKQQNTEQPQEPEQKEPEQKEPEKQESEQKNTEPKSQKPKARKPKAQPPKNLKQQNTEQPQEPEQQEPEQQEPEQQEPEQQEPEQQKPEQQKPEQQKEHAFITFEDVVKQYTIGDTVTNAVNGACFTIEKGELAVVLGSSGAGKTTILNILGGIDTATGGHVFVDERDVCTLSEAQLGEYRRYDIGFVFQFYNLIQNLTARENVELAVQICPEHLNVDEVLDAVGLADRKDNFPSQLSGGEQQRVAIARALAKNPKLLLCDEPTGALDYETGKMILSLLQDTCYKTGMTVVLITHNTAVAGIANRVIRLRSGIVESVVKNETPMLVQDIEW